MRLVHGNACASLSDLRRTNHEKPATNIEWLQIQAITSSNWWIAYKLKDIRTCRVSIAVLYLPAKTRVSVHAPKCVREVLSLNFIQVDCKFEMDEKKFMEPLG